MKRSGAFLLSFLLLGAPVLTATDVAEAKITKEMAEELRPEIDAGLKSNDPLQRAYAILAAGLLEDKKLNKELEPFLESTDKEIRHAAIIALASNKDKKGLSALDAELEKAGSGRYVLMTSLLPRLPEKLQIDVLKGMTTGKKVDPARQKDALRYLAEYSEGTVYDQLGQITKEKKPEGRAPFADILLRNPRPEAFAWAEKLFAEKKDVEARRLGLKLALAIGGPKVDGMARAALTDADPAVQKLGLDHLAARKDPSATDAMLAQLKVAGSDADKIRLVDAILTVGHSPPLAQAAGLLDGGTDNPDLRRAYYRLFGATKAADAVDRLRKLETSTNIQERRDAIVGLAWTRSPVAVQILTRTIYDGDPEVARLSVEGFGVIADPTTVKTLQTALNKSRDTETQHALVRALGRIKSDEAANVLMFKVRDRDLEVKRLALEGLAYIRSKTTLSVLDILIKDTDPGIRLQSTLLLLELDKAKGMALLGKALERPPEDYLDQVMLLPTPLRDEVLLFMLKSTTPKLREDAWNGLILLGRDGLGLVRIVAAEEYPKDVRAQAIDVLSLRTDPTDVNLFKRLAQAGSDDEKLLAMRWLLRRAAPDMSGFFRTLMNGFKADLPKRTVALYGLLKSEK